MHKIIAVDAMSGDHGPQVVVPAVARMLATYPECHIELVGDSAVLKPMVENGVPQSHQSRVTIVASTQVVSMEDAPAVSLRSKKDSSMRVALDRVKSGHARACVSAGNTGALMATARFVLKTLPGVDRPAIMATLPTRSEKKVRILDLGANVDSSPEHLYQFAVMGAVLTQAVGNILSPRVALLNVGQEQIKGNDVVKAAASIFMQRKTFDYVGFIEADQWFADQADVIVCDGFSGNILLKGMEGIIRFVSHLGRKEAKNNLFTGVLAVLARPFMRRLSSVIDPEHYNGAAFLGLNGIVIKSHGAAQVDGFYSALEEALLEVNSNIPERIGRGVAEILGKTEG